MTNRGRRSIASLAVLTPQPGQRPAPPADLTAEQAATWRAVVGAKPADYFGADTMPLLAAYVRHTACARRLSDALEAIGWDVPVERLAPLLRLRDRETKAVMAMARALRLTQQATMTPQSAATRSNAVSATGHRPWDAVPDA